MPFFEKATLKAVIMVLTAASGAYATTTMVLPYFSTAQGNGYFILTLSPSQLEIPQGATGDSTVMLVSRNGFTGTVTLSITYAEQTLPAVLQDETLSLSAGGAATTTLTISPPSNATPTDYGLIVTGREQGHKRSLLSSALVYVEVYSPGSLTASFTLRVDPSAVNNLAGSSNSVQVTVSSLNSFSGTVNLTVTVPFGWVGVMGGQNPVTLTANSTASTTLQVTTTQNTEPGSYQILVTGKSGLQSASTAITVNVARPFTEALTLTSYSFASPTNLTLYLHNTGDVQVNLLWYIVRDANGNAWGSSGWAGPTIQPGGTASASILIWSSCSSCYYSGILGMFNEFVTGRTYTVVLGAESGSQFTFTVTR